MVQDLATQWLQSNPCKKKSSGDGKEFTKVPLQYCHTAAWMRNGGQIPLNVPVMCEMFKMGKHLTNGDFENHSKDQLFRLVQW